ncbi:2633_t:CDS:2 [Cetraspora pellucida]|uniref:2633_t:CDS:1 n=1 Tax=Cetraspora pellucida TaxID=1433469 RepID=A0A9N9JZ07_9GLOM|nr:2633_t:CDS:2 [Cetraspora pellucida]
MHLFKENKDGFNLSYSFETDIPLLWWMINYTGFKSIEQLAIKVFSITPHASDKTLSLNELQAQVVLATFLFEDDERIIEDFKVEKLELNNLEIIEYDEFQNYDVKEYNEFNFEEFVSSKEGQDIFDFDSIELATDLVKE